MYRVKDEYVDQFYGNTESEYIEECQTNGIPEDDMYHLVSDWGDEVFEMLEEI